MEQLLKTLISPKHSFIQIMPKKLTIWTIESSSLAKALGGREI